MRQIWHDLLFAHWPVAVDVLRALVPASLSIDTFGGHAWLGIVPFRMSGIRLRRSFAWPWISEFPELNVRTYVTLGDRPGVWFFSLDAGNRIAVALARRWYHLPYFQAHMTVRTVGQTVHYSSHRNHRGAPEADLTVEYEPEGEAFRASSGTLEHWLTERYCLYSVDTRGRLHRAEIDHPPWTLHRAVARFAVNTMTRAQGIVLPDVPPLLHFARRQHVRVWAPRRLDAVML